MRRKVCPIDAGHQFTVVEFALPRPELLLNGIAVKYISPDFENGRSACVAHVCPSNNMKNEAAAS
jgi:hypothetical protein